MAKTNKKSDLKNPLLSIIIQHHGGVDILNECLASLEKSTYKDYEIIIVDNASKDNSIKEDKKKSSILTMNYKFYLEGWSILLAPLLKILIPRWNEKVWKEDFPVKIRRQKVLSMNFKDFISVNYLAPMLHRVVPYRSKRKTYSKKIRDDMSFFGYDSWPTSAVNEMRKMANKTKKILPNIN